jgi:hypothetical protein
VTLDDTRHVFQKWLHLPDTGSLDAVLATVMANRLDGDPVWLLLVGPPGGGKSEILNAVSPLEDAYPAGTLTEASLLSGTPKRETMNGAKGGLLRNIGDYGIIVAKDFGSVLSMNRDARATLLAALREVYDGAWTRHIGSDGGRTLHWTGKVGLVGACTPTIDRHHAVMGAMGERFILYRLPEVDANMQGREALAHAGKERQMRKELAAATAQFLASRADVKPARRTEQETARLITLATLIAKARSAVERDGFSREIELVSAPEAPTRITIMLARILDGLSVLGASRGESWQLLTKVAFDCIPALRLACLVALAENGKLDTTDIAQKVRHPGNTTRRALEDLTAHGLVDVERQGEGKAHLWDVTDFALSRFDEVSTWGLPEMSSYIRTRIIIGTDTTGNPPMEESGLQPVQTAISDDFPF